MGVTGTWQKCLYIWEKDIDDLIAFLRSRREGQPNRLTIGVDVRIGMVRVAKSGSDFLLSHPTADADALVDYYSFLALHFDVLYVDDNPQPNPSKIISYSRSRELRKNRILAKIETVAFQTATDQSQSENRKKKRKKIPQARGYRLSPLCPGCFRTPRIFSCPSPGRPSVDLSLEESDDRCYLL